MEDFLPDLVVYEESAILTEHTFGPGCKQCYRAMVVDPAWLRFSHGVLDAYNIAVQCQQQKDGTNKIATPPLLKKV